MRKLTGVGTTTLAAFAVSTALTAAPALAQVGGPPAQTDRPQTTTPPPVQPGAPALGTPNAGAPAPSPAPGQTSGPSAAASPKTSSPPSGMGGKVGAEDTSGRKPDEQAGGKPRWYQAGPDEKDEPSFEEGASRRDRNGFGQRFGSDDGWRYSERRYRGPREEAWGDRGDFDEGRRGNREDFHRFGRGDREDMRGGGDWPGRAEPQPWRRGREAFGGDREGFGPSRGSGGQAGATMGPRPLAAICGPGGGERMLGQMLQRLERLTNPKDAQRESFERLVQGAEKARDLVRDACPTDDLPVTLPGRLALAEKRLTAMLDALRTLRPALDEFYASLSEEQKARLYLGSPGGRGAAQRWPGDEHFGERRGGRSEQRRGGDPRWSGDRPDFGFGPGFDGDRDGWLDDWRGPS